MQSLNFNEGYQEFTINNDPDRVIRFNPSDVGLVNRYKKTVEVMENLLKEFDGTQQKSEETMEKLDAEIKKQIDYLFNQPVSEVVFGNQSCLSLLNGETLAERFIECVAPVIVKETRKEMKLSQKRIEKYVKAAKGA